MVDFANVKKIVDNTLGKEVVKIQDKNGVVLWQKTLLEVLPTSKSVAYGSGSFALTIKTEGAWTISCPASEISFSKTSGTGND